MARWATVAYGPPAGGGPDDEVTMADVLRRLLITPQRRPHREDPTMSPRDPHPFEHGPAPEPSGEPDVVVQEVPTDLPDEDLPAPVDEDGRPLTREDEMVEPADSEDLEYREMAGSVGPETADLDAEPTPLA